MWFAPSDGNVGYIACIYRSWTGRRGTKADPMDGDHLLFSFLTSNANNLLGVYHEDASHPARQGIPGGLDERSIKGVYEFQKPEDDSMLTIVSDVAEFAKRPEQPTLL